MDEERFLRALEGQTQASERLATVFERLLALIEQELEDDKAGR